MSKLSTSRVLHNAATDSDEAVTKVLGLSRRGNSWQFRRAIPEKLRHILERREIVEALKPCSRKEAEVWAYQRIAASNALFQQAEASHLAKSEWGPIRPRLLDHQRRLNARPSTSHQISLDENAIREIAVRYFLSLEGNDGFTESEVAAQLEISREALVALNSLPSGAGAEDATVQQVAQAAANARGIPEDALLPKTFYRLAEWIYEAITEHHLRVQDRLSQAAPRSYNPTFSAVNIDHLLRQTGSTPTSHVPRMEAQAKSCGFTQVSGPAIMGIFEAYANERKLAEATLKAWRAAIVKLIAFLGHDEAQRVTAEDIVKWKDHLALTPTAQGKSLAAKTIREKYLSAAHVVFSYAVENRQLSSNPASGVKVRGPSAPKKRGFNDAEAKIILNGALRPASTRTTDASARARRWAPWICAYTGARTGEITQLRAEDVVEEDGISIIRITPDAGSVKNHELRKVPLHSHIIEQGFLDFAKRVGSGPLLYDPQLHRGGKMGNPQHKKMAERLAKWVRTELRLTDGDVQPNHGWRHRFKTIGRSVDMNIEARDVIVGHAPRTVGERYGTWELKDLQREIEKIPRYEV